MNVTRVLLVVLVVTLGLIAVRGRNDVLNGAVIVAAAGLLVARLLARFAARRAGERPPGH